MADELHNQRIIERSRVVVREAANLEHGKGYRRSLVEKSRAPAE